ncbi:MAG: TIGR01906 family membrane protein [Clostridia bacterium]|nr:TIGR01906 family membrane protein [Clostridia bacterium]
MKAVNIILSVLFVISVVVLTITVSIGLPIYVRPFYYAHVDALALDEKWGIDREYIIEAYDEVLDFLTLEGREFGTGKLIHSEEGKGHFEDCKVLFDLNRNALIISLIVLVILLVLNKLGVIRLVKPRGYGLTFWAGIGTLALFASLAVVVAMDFSAAFTVFHKIFFPGKDNWLFDPYTDPIILFMPQQFFMNCAILICASILLISAAFIVIGKIRKARGK